MYVDNGKWKDYITKILYTLNEDRVPYIYTREELRVILTDQHKTPLKVFHTLPLGLRTVTDIEQTTHIEMHYKFSRLKRLYYRM